MRHKKGIGTDVLIFTYNLLNFIQYIITDTLKAMLFVFLLM